MKKIALLLVLTFIVAMLVSSCNKKTCPAYRGAKMTQVEYFG
ncbi:MAG: hypothetical protein ABSG89_07820 [Bacteroidales bacterium]|jgi:hypothetical protein